MSRTSPNTSVTSGEVRVNDIAAWDDAFEKTVYSRIH